MKKYLFLVCLFFITQVSSACLNYYYGVDREGNLHDVESVRIGFNTNFNTKLIVTKIKKLKEKLEKERSYFLLSDYALSLLKLGKHKESLEILATLSIHYPLDYKIASNLGTAYEINGNVDSALKYIKRGLQLNPYDHSGSEWIHVKILETKKTLLTDPNYLSNHTVLGLTEAQEKEDKTGDQINIQVRERFPFCKGPDLIMASLMVDLADCYVNTESIEFAIPYYWIAKEYYGDKNPVIDKKIAEAKSLLKKHKDVQPNSEDQRSEGDHARTAGVKYADLLDDNNTENYQPNWKEIEYNVDTLLALCDLTKTQEEVKFEAEKHAASWEYELIPEEKDSVPHSNTVEEKKEENEVVNDSERKPYFTWISIVVMILTFVGIFIFRKKNPKQF